MTQLKNKSLEIIYKNKKREEIKENIFQTVYKENQNIFIVGKQMINQIIMFKRAQKFANPKSFLFKNFRKI